MMSRSTQALVSFRQRTETMRSMQAMVPLFLALALVLAACGGGASETSDTAPAPTAPAVPEAAPAWEPSGQVTMVVPFSPGGGSDVLGRAVQAGLERCRPGLIVNVENRTGGAGGVGYGYFAEQDGNPLFLLPAEVTRSILPARQNVPFDWDTWTSVGMFFEDIAYFVVNASSPYETIEQFMATAVERAAAGRPMTVGVPAAGGIDEILARGLAAEFGTTFEIVAYNGTGETNPALLGNDIEATVVNPSDTRQELQANLFRGLVGFSEKRLEGDADFGDIPAAGEFGWALTATKYRGVIMPPNVPQEAVEYFQSALECWTTTDSFREYRARAGLAENIYWGTDWDDWIRDVWNPQVIPGLG